MLYSSTWWISLTETSPLVEQRLLPNTLSQAAKEKRIHTGEHGTHMAHIVQYYMNMSILEEMVKHFTN
jgi:hypothetical protein